MVGLIFIGNIEYCPYISKYTRILEEQNLQYKILFWDRENESYENNRYFVYHKEMPADIHPVFKLKDFIRYQSWLRKAIKECNFTRYILLDTLSAMLLSGGLIKHGKGRYLCDVRDYSYEKLSFFKRRERKLFQAAGHVYISSPGFRAFLPEGIEYITTHNFLEKDVERCKNKRFVPRRENSVLNVVWIGAIRYFEHQIRLIRRLRGDKRFHMIYHGIGPDYQRLLAWAKEHQIENIEFTGKYQNAEKYNLLRDADILINSYDLSLGFEVKYAISNKFYDGLIFRIPQLAEPGTYKAERIERLKVGIALDIENESFGDELYAFYYHLDAAAFNAACEKEMKRVIKEERRCIESLTQFLEEEKRGTSG